MDTTSRVVPKVAAAPRATAARAIEEPEFVDLYRRTARPLWGYLRRVTGDPDLADDLLQEAFTRLLAQQEPPADEPARRAWLYRTASRLAIDESRRTHRRPAAGDDEAAAQVPAAAAPARDPLLARAVGAALHDLAPNERALLWLAYVDEASHRDIAGALGLKEGSVRVLLFRARKKMAALWARRRGGA